MVRFIECMNDLVDTKSTQLAAGKSIRMGRIMGPNGRVVIVALDHGVCGVRHLDALAEPDQFIREMAAVGADCVLVTPGTARRFASAFGRIGVVIRIDGGPTSATGRWDNIRPMIEVEDAQRLGADGVVAMGLIGTDTEEESLRYLAAIVAECDRLGMVLIAEMLPGGLGATEISTDQLAVAAHVAAELGADIVKLPYRGPYGEFRSVTENCYRPIVVLGGPKREDGNIFADLEGAMQAGAAGVAIGRNVWGDSKPSEVAARLVDIVHDAASKSP